uniref:Methyltransferase tdiE n=1 Tax=Fusarium oxysporum (strain Fo5176) TaxID=660025 RepID=A0A0D2YEY1_FUSOF
MADPIMLSKKELTLNLSERRMIDSHMLFTLTFDGSLINHPQENGSSRRRVLDAGTGTGVWAIDYADAGFVDIVETMYKWPSNGWPRDPKYKEMGLWNYENLGNGASGLSMALFTRALGWTAEEVEVFLVDVRKDMRNHAIHGWWPIYVVYGRKP